jgi:hypothetical protein
LLRRAVAACRAYGNTVSGFLLTMFDHPKWLLTVVNLIAVFQLLVGEQASSSGV